jgi:hypothetical protein
MSDFFKFIGREIMHGMMWIDQAILQSYLCLIPEIARKQGEVHLPYYTQPLQIIGNQFVRETYEEFRVDGYNTACLKIAERLKSILRSLKHDRWIDMYIVVCDISINPPANVRASIIDCQLHWTRTKAEAMAPNKVTWSNRTTLEEDEKAYSDWFLQNSINDARPINVITKLSKV